MSMKKRYTSKQPSTSTREIALFELFEDAKLLRSFVEQYMRVDHDLDAKLLKLENKIKQQNILSNKQTYKNRHIATDEEIIATYKKGGSLLTMARRINISTTQLITKAKRLGLYQPVIKEQISKPTAPKTRKHKINDEEFINLIKQGPISWRALSIHFDVSMDCVIYTAKRLNIKKVDMNTVLLKLTKAKLQKALEKKRSWKTISLHLNVSIPLLMKKAKEWGLTKERMKPGAKRKPVNQ